MQVFFPAVEPHINTVAAAIVSKAGVKRLMDIADQVSDKPQGNPPFAPRRFWRVEHLHIPRNSFDDSVAQFAVTLLVVAIRVPAKIYVVVRVHIGNLAASFVRPCRCFGQSGALREKLFDPLASSIGELSFGDSGDDFVTFAAPGVSR